MIDRTALIEKLVPAAGNDPRALAAVARQLLAAGAREQAIALAGQVFAMTGGGGEAGTIAREMLSDGVPSWHFAIPRDQARNDAYEAALRRAIRPGMKVLEIGTGTGLLAMMAARAGADVITCEADPAVAAAASDVIAANGLADRIRVVNLHSTMLDPDRDMGGLADLLVSEIVSNDLLSEGVLDAHEDAVSRLLTPGAVVIPARGSVRVALAADLRARSRQLADVNGFDLRAFNRLAAPYELIPIGSGQIALRSAPADLFGFDFATGGPWRGERAECRLESHGGTIDGIVQWIAIELDPEIRYENCPGLGQAACWGVNFWRFPVPIETRRGAVIAAQGAHERDRLRLWHNQLLTVAPDDSSSRNAGGGR